MTKILFDLYTDSNTSTTHVKFPVMVGIKIQDRHNKNQHKFAKLSLKKNKLLHGA